MKNMAKDKVRIGVEGIVTEGVYQGHKGVAVNYDEEEGLVCVVLLGVVKLSLPPSYFDQSKFI